MTTLRREVSRPASLVLALLAAGLLPGCGPGPAGDGGAAHAPAPASTGAPAPATGRPTAADPGTGADSSADRIARELRREAAPDRQVPAALLDALRPGAESWVAAWRVGLGLFRLEQLERDRERALPADTLAAFDASQADQELRLRHLYVPSPDASLLVDTRLDWSLEEREGRVHARRGGPAGVLLVRLREHAQQRIFEPGPGARVDGAVWLGPGTLALLASEPLGGNRRAGGPVLYVVDLAHGRETRYVGPTADLETLAQVGRRLDDSFRRECRGMVFD